MLLRILNFKLGVTMSITSFESVLVCCIFLMNIFVSPSKSEVEVKFTEVWGPGLNPELIILPARYFFIHVEDNNNVSYTSSSNQPFTVSIEGRTKSSRPCRIWMNILDRKDGSYIVRYRLYEVCYNLKIEIKYKDKHVAKSPYEFKNPVFAEDCNCPVENVETMLANWKCRLPNQLATDLTQFTSIDWDILREKVISHYDRPHSISLCHYVIKSNEIYRHCYGKYVGFKMFIDSILLSLSRKVHLPDVEFFVNLGDWPLVSHTLKEKFPIFSWCGSTDTYDIVMPTYDITESSLESMGRVMLDMLSVQGNVGSVWEERIPKLFWRGRDSNRYRLDLIDIARQHPQLFNVSLTNFFFFRDEEQKYGPKTDHVSFFSFFDYKYQLGIDGTVAAYRLPYLLGGGSLLFKQDSKFYEHFYTDLEPYIHYVPVKKDLSNLVDQLEWAIKNDGEAKIIAKNGQDFANQHLLPKDIFCYYAQLLYEFKKLIKSEVNVLEGMEKVPVEEKVNCDCKNDVKDEL